MEVALRPVTDIAADALGYAGGDWLHERGIKARARLQEKTRKELETRGVTPEDAPPSVLIPLLIAAQDESREELLDLWAKLLAATLDPNRAGSVRREFIEAVRQMEPLDAKVLQSLQPSAPGQSTGGELPRMQRNSDEVLVAIQHLHSLRCVENPSASGIQQAPTEFAAVGNMALTSFGRELLKLIQP